MLFMSSVAELQELASWSVAVTWHSASLQSSSTRTPFSLQQVYTSTCVYAFTWFCCSVLCKPAQTTGPAVSRGYWLRTEGPWQRRICIRMPPPTRTRPFSARDCAHSIELDFLKKRLGENFLKCRQLTNVLSQKYVGRFSIDRRRVKFLHRNKKTEIKWKTGKLNWVTGRRTR